ncbi:Uncharacterised protein [Mycobacteroides abscessus subsp. abscessus]|uniref:hypothetical protein n=1 Tax=Mycobacteroides abscessus TaxID=36809 RepID=UPI000929AAA5|nr:hypothetical protein [Mycobacteroides abscessus]SHP28232.1 Uncharacterised protein [Mycobacteroides abscessus subsp. abscessus]SHP68097.1 Uncharacterised protein [Mycobacteroides abscessus subsp. abscessus]SHY39035.1 Uncharacterised protein [Mycobacteroides abscessus subsp. abscessus]SKD94146.1 Uncharacterised protein [Mycobacteroides abscessus subsp. abscessus]
MTDSMERAADIARRATLYRVARTAGVMDGLLGAAIIREHLLRPEWTEGMDAMKKVSSLAQRLADQDLDGSPESDAIRAAAAKMADEGDAEMWCRHDEFDDYEADDDG